jgi:hypothetical protein
MKLVEQIGDKSTLIVTPSAFPTHSVLALLFYNKLAQNNGAYVLWIDSEKDMSRVAGFYTAYFDRFATVTILTVANLTSFTMNESKSTKNGMILTTPAVVDMIVQKRKGLLEKCALLVYSESVLAKDLDAKAYTTCCRVITNICSCTSNNNIQTIALSRIPSVSTSSLVSLMSEAGLLVRQLIFILIFKQVMCKSAVDADTLPFLVQEQQLVSIEGT